MSKVTLHFVWGHLSRKQTVSYYSKNTKLRGICIVSKWCSIVQIHPPFGQDSKKECKVCQIVVLVMIKWSKEDEKVSDHTLCWKVSAMLSLRTPSLWRRLWRTTAPSWRTDSYGSTSPQVGEKTEAATEGDEAGAEVCKCLWKPNIMKMIRHS